MSFSIKSKEELENLSRNIDMLRQCFIIIIFFFSYLFFIVIV